MQTYPKWQDQICTGCKFAIPGDCAARYVGDDDYLHFPQDGCYESSGEHEPIDGGAA